MNWMENANRRWLIGLLALAVAACSAPNLDETVAGKSEDTIRQLIVDHGPWKETMSDEQLDQVAGFIADYAGTAESGEAAGAPGLAIWKANECGSCHTLAATGPGD